MNVRISAGHQSIRAWWPSAAPASGTTVGVTRLAGPDFMVEIEVVAVVNS